MVSACSGSRKCRTSGVINLRIRFYMRTVTGQKLKGLVRSIERLFGPAGQAVTLFRPLRRYASSWVSACPAVIGADCVRLTLLLLSRRQPKGLKRPRITAYAASATRCIRRRPLGVREYANKSILACRHSLGIFHDSSATSADAPDFQASNSILQ